VSRDDSTPSVSIIITAYNEDKSIASKLDNCLGIDYPEDSIEIIVASDGSTDRTNDIVKSYSDRGVRLVEICERNGKHFAQKQGIDVSNHDIVVFTDATTMLERDSIRMIVRSFADPKIGCVSGKDRIDVGGEPSHGEGIYVRYEMKLRSLESSISSLVGVSGSFFAARKTICETWYSDLSSDFFVPIVAYMQGYRSVLDDDAIGRYAVVADPEREFERKVRTVVHGIQVLIKLKSILNPFRYGFYAFQMFNHKLMRWIVPLAFIACLIANIFLVDANFLYELLLALQVSFYVTALGAYMVKSLEKQTLFKIPFFLVMVNLSIIVAWFKYCCGEKYISWERTER
jgi:glycosyltransferase involved in cell wall biosynthesis